MKELVENSLDAGAKSIGKSPKRKYEALTKFWLFQMSDLKIMASMSSRFKTVAVESRQRTSIVLVSPLNMLDMFLFTNYVYSSKTPYLEVVHL